MDFKPLSLLKDISVYFALFITLALVSRLFLLPTGDYLTSHLSLALFFLPGWFLAVHFLDFRQSLLFRLYLAAVLSFIGYGLIASVCFALSLSFLNFYVLYSIFTLICLAASSKKITATSLKKHLKGYDLTKIIFLLLLSLLLINLFDFPRSNDMRIFATQKLDHLFNQNFEYSSLGMIPHGVTEALPRMRAHLFHVFMALLADFSGCNLLAMVHYLVTIPFGMLLLAALYYFVNAVVGDKKYNYVWISLSLLAPLLLFFNYSHQLNMVWGYSFRLLNNPVLDKDFAQFFILPSLAFLSLVYLKTNKPRYLLLLLLATPLMLYFHPLIPVYFFILVAILVLSFLKTASRNQLLGLALIAIGHLAFFAFGKAQASHHQFIDQLVEHSMIQPEPLFGPGHYGSFQDTYTVKRYQEKMILNPHLLFIHNNLIRPSLIFTLIWGLFIYYRKQQSSDEKIAFRIQLLFILALFGLFALSPVLFHLKPYTYRGIERLHWFYFGFFAFYYVFNHAFDLFVKRFKTKKLRNRLAQVPVVLVSCYFLIHIMVFQLKLIPSSSFFPVVKSLIETPFMLSLINEPYITPKTLATQPPVRPSWLTADDIIYMQDGRCYQNRPNECRHLIAQSIYYRELYHEAFAYEKRGEEFLQDFDAFYDGYFNKVTERLVDFVVKEKVNIVISKNENFVKELASRLKVEPKVLGPNVYSLNR